MLRSSERWKLAGLLGLAGAVALSAVCASPRQEPGHKQQTVTEEQSLRRGEAFELDAPPPVATNSGFKCDEDGDIYVVYSDSALVLSQGNGLSGVPVWKISLRSEQVVRYPVPARIQDFEGHVFRSSFDVSPDGTLYALFNTGRRGSDGKMKPEALIGRYNDDGGIDSYVHVGQMRGTGKLQPLRMAVFFRGGGFLLSGTNVLENGLGSFTGLFTGSGEFVKLLTLGKPVMTLVEHHEGSNAASQSAKPVSHAKQLEAEAENPIALESSVLSFSARDGNLYLLKGTSDATLYVVSPVGEVLRQHRLKPPDPDLSPLQMASAGAGHLFIHYGYVSTGGPSEEAHPRDVITVLNSVTGQVIATYRMPEAQRLELPACAASPQKFTFLAATEDHRHLAVIPYSAP